MQSIRFLARAAPRASAIARLTSTSLRTSLRPSWSTLSSNSIRTQTPCLTAAFSTSRSRFDASATELAAKLQSELQLETEQSETTSTASDGNVKAFFNETDWTLHDTEGEAVVKLSRKHEGELIEVRFTIADFNTPYEGENESADEALLDEEEELGEGQSGGANTKGAINQGKTSGGNFKVAPEDDVAPADREDLRDSEDDSQAAFPANVNVLISHPSAPKKGALRINLVTDSGEFRVESVTHFASADLPEAQVASQPLDTETTYAGPPFPQLDEDLQALLEGYLNERGIDTGLALVIPEYIDVKEQKEYLRWLSKVKEFVE